MRIRVRLRNQLKNSFHAERTASIKRKLTENEYKLQKSYHEQQDSDEQKAVSAIKINPKYFYAYSRRHQKVKTPIGPLNIAAGKTTTDPQEMAEILAEQYNSAFSIPSTSMSPQPTRQQTCTIDNVEFSEEHIMKAIDEVGHRSSAGPDRFPATLLKNCKEVLAKPLFLIYRLSSELGEVPSILKESVITPIYKDGDKRIPKYYRHVALTSHWIKFW